jgi:uncharacterized protein (DUF608 family)
MNSGLLFSSAARQDWQPICSPLFPRAVGFVQTNEQRLEGVPLGGIGTGFTELCVNGRFGRTTAYQSLTPPREMDWPAFAIVSKGTPYALALSDVKGIESPRAIHLWGHFPIADFEYELPADVRVALRAWSPFLPGEAIDSNTPVAFFDFHLHNPSDAECRVELHVNLPGPTVAEAGSSAFERAEFAEPLPGATLQCGEKFGMAVAVDGATECQFTEAFAGLPALAPHGCDTQESNGIGLRAVLTLGPHQQRRVRVIWSWYAAEWVGTFYRNYIQFYTRRFQSARDVLHYAITQGEEWLQRIAAWQNAIYQAPDTPPWLADQLINTLHTIPKDSFWAANSVPPVAWCEDGGIFGLSESPRTVPHVAIPSDFYGSLPFVFFFPDLLKQILRSYAYFQLKTGEIPLGVGWGADLGSPIYDFLHTTNSANFIDLTHRLWLCERDPAILHEFYPAVRGAINFLASLDRDGDGLLDLDPWPTGNQFYGGWHWTGTATHTNGFYLAALQMALRMADASGHAEDAAHFHKLLAAARQHHDATLWNGNWYSLFHNTHTGERDETILANQLVGLFLQRLHGLESLYEPDKVKAVLDTVVARNVRQARSGMYNAIHEDGSLNPDGGDQSTQMFTGEALAVAATLLYEGRREEGLPLAEAVMRNLVIDQQRGWNLPNQVNPENGKPVFGTDFYQMLMLWTIPLALQRRSIEQTCHTDGFIGGLNTHTMADVTI